MSRQIKGVCIAIIAILLGIAQFDSKVVAADTYYVSTAASAIRKINDTQYLIPVYLLNNKGIMGFRLYLGYSNTDLRIDSITSGLVTQKGTFASDVGIDENIPYINVLWNTTENVNEDGSLLYMVVTLLNENINEIKIHVDYSTEDTFDEKWKDVTLNCHDIVYSLLDVKKEETRKIDEEEPVEIFNIAEREEEIPFIEKAEEVIQSNKKIQDIGENTIKRVLIQNLKKYNAKSVNDVSQEEEDSFWNDVQSDLTKQEGVRRKQLEGIDLKQVAEQICITDDEYYGEVEDVDVTDDVKNTNNKDVKTLIIGMTIVIVAGLFGVIVHKRRKKNG